MRLLDMNPQWLLVGLGAGIAAYAWMNPAGFAGLLGRLGIAAAGKAGEAAVELASNYSAPVMVAKAGDSFAQTDAAQTLRGWVGLPDLTTAETQAACKRAMDAGDDLAAMKYCSPLTYAGGWFDGK